MKEQPLPRISGSPDQMLIVLLDKEWSFRVVMGRKTKKRMLLMDLLVHLLDEKKLRYGPFRSPTRSR